MENFYDGLRISIHNTLSQVSEKTVNDIIHAIENASFDSLTDLQLVQEEDLMHILKPIPRQKLIKAWNKPGMVEELKWECRKRKNKDESQQINELLVKPRNTSEFTIIPDHSAVVREPVTVDHNSHEDSTDTSCNASSSIPDLSTFAKREASMFSSHIDTLEPLPKKFCHDMDQTSPSSHSPSSHSPSELSSRVLNCNGMPENRLYNLLFKKCGKWKLNKSLILLRVYAKYKTELSSASVEENLELWRKIADEVHQRSHCSRCFKSRRSARCTFINESECMNQIEILKFHYHEHKNVDVLSNSMLKFFHAARNAFDTTENSGMTQVKLHKLLFKECGIWKQKMCRVLLKVYAQYKTKLSCPDEEKPDVWRKIAEEVHQKSKCLRCFRGGKTCSFVRGSDCMNKVETLRLQYHEHKNESMCSGELVKFFKIARYAFETTENSVTTFAETSSNVSLNVPSFKWIWRKRLALLRLYAIYKTELSSSEINVQNAWNKIAKMVGNNNPQCDGQRCCNQIFNMKCEYARMKHIEPFESRQLEQVFLDEAENAFGIVENPVVFSVDSNLEKHAMNKPDSLKLLQVYAKYKEELLLQNFDVERQIVWEKVARDVSKKCSSFYGKRRCCYEIHKFKKLYEMLKKKSLKKKGLKRKPYFFDEARKIFDSTECLGQHGEASSLKDFTAKQKRRDWYGEANFSKDSSLKQEIRDQYGEANFSKEYTVVKQESTNSYKVVNFSKECTVKQESTDSYQEVNFSKGCTVKQERRGWYEHTTI